MGLKDKKQERGEPIELVTAKEVKKEAEVIQQKALDAYKAILAAAQAVNPDLVIPHDVLNNIIDLVREFYSGSRQVAEYLKAQALEISEALKKVPGFVAIFGLGYPFYVAKEGEDVIEVPEIYSFIHKIRDLVAKDLASHPEGWICPNCQENSVLPDLKTYCKSCSLVEVKPRELLSVIPDLDIVVIIDNPDERTERKITEILAKFGYAQSDTDIKRALEETRQAMGLILRGDTSSVAKVPIDAHIWSLQAFKECMELVESGETKVTIQGRALHMQWENHIINFWFDFMFSLTLINNQNEELKKQIVNTRRKMFDLYQDKEDDLISVVASMSDRARRLLESEQIRRLFIARFKEWGENAGQRRD